MLNNRSNTIRIIFIYITFVCLITINALSVCAQEQETTAFINVNVIPMNEERVLEKQTVLIVKDRIEKIGPSLEIKIPTGNHGPSGMRGFGFAELESVPHPCRPVDVLITAPTLDLKSNRQLLTGFVDDLDGHPLIRHRREYAERQNQQEHNRDT